MSNVKDDDVPSELLNLNLQKERRKNYDVRSRALYIREYSE